MCVTRKAWRIASHIKSIYKINLDKSSRLINSLWMIASHNLSCITKVLWMSMYWDTVPVAIYLLTIVLSRDFRLEQWAGFVITHLLHIRFIIYTKDNKQDSCRLCNMFSLQCFGTTVIHFKNIVWNIGWSLSLIWMRKYFWKLFLHS